MNGAPKMNMNPLIAEWLNACARAAWMLSLWLDSAAEAFEK